MYILPALAFFFLTQAVLAAQPTPLFPDAKLTPGDTFDVTAQDVCVPGYAKKVRAVPAWLKRQAYACLLIPDPLYYRGTKSARQGRAVSNIQPININLLTIFSRH